MIFMLWVRQPTPHPSRPAGTPSPLGEGGEFVGAVSARINPCPSTFACTGAPGPSQYDRVQPFFRSLPGVERTTYLRSNCLAGVLQYKARPWPTPPTEPLHLGRSMPLLHNPALHLKCRKTLWGSVGPCAQAFAGWRRPFSSGLRAWGASELDSQTQESAPTRGTARTPMHS